MSATAEGNDQATEARRRPSTWREAGVIARDRYSALAGFVVLIAVFWILEPSTFGTWTNFNAILQQAAPIVVLAVGVTVVLATGEYDLSFTGIITLAPLFGVLLMRDDHAGAFVAVVVILAIGTVGGLVSGALVAMERASSFIVTLALGTVYTALATGISGGQTISSVTPGYLSLTLNSVDGVNISIIVAAIVTVVAFALMRWTVFGRQAQAIGSNQKAARLAGIRIALTRTGAFVFLGLCSAISGVLLSSSTGGFNPSLGEGLFIPPFVAAFFGMAVLGAARFNVFGTVVGALFTGTFQTGLVIVGTQAWVGDATVGVVLLVILLIATARSSR